MSNPLMNIFGRSPVKPLQEHMAHVSRAVEDLKAFLKASSSNDWAEAEKIQLQIVEHENLADALKLDIRLHLPKSLFLPAPREDLLLLLSDQDKIANLAKDIAGLMLGRQMSFPASIQDQVHQYLDSAADTVAEASQVTSQLDELVESGFSGHEVDLVKNLLNRLDELENLNDQLQIEVRAALFEIEAELPPVNVMFLYRIIETIGDIADYAQKVGHRLRLLLAR